MLKAAKLTGQEKKQLRRERILDSARSLMSDNDEDALSLRNLARAADVTVPTIYNLVGGRGAVLFHLLTEFQEQLKERLPVFDDELALEMLEILYNTIVDVFTEDEDYYRGCFLALEELHKLREPIADTTGGNTRYVGMQVNPLLISVIEKATAGKNNYVVKWIPKLFS